MGIINIDELKISESNINNKLKSTYNSNYSIDIFVSKTLWEAEHQGIQILEYTEPGEYDLFIPYGVESITVTACGGGGGGGKYKNSIGDPWTIVHAGPSGGGGAAVVNRVIPISEPQNLHLTVGVRGKGYGTVSNETHGTATDGGTTIIGEYLTLPGGKVGTNQIGGKAGGEGGGNGGQSAFHKENGQTGQSKPGQDGILGKGGTAKAQQPVDDVYQTWSPGGGGGSLGDGAPGNKTEKEKSTTNYGAGGAGANKPWDGKSNAGAGGPGYISIQFNWKENK